VKLIPALLPVLRNLVRSGIRVRMVLVEGGRLTRSFVAELHTAGVATDLLPLSSDLWSMVPPLDCLLLASQSEGLPLVALEAMARGIPVISTRVGGMPEIIEHGVSGWLYEPDDAAGLEKAFRILADDLALFASIGTAGQETVRRRMDTSTHQHELSQIYRALSRYP